MAAESVGASGGPTNLASPVTVCYVGSNPFLGSASMTSSGEDNTSHWQRLCTNDVFWRGGISKSLDRSISGAHGPIEVIGRGCRQRGSD
jgi:hypothetical protein